MLLSQRCCPFASFVGRAWSGKFKKTSLNVYRTILRSSVSTIAFCGLFPDWKKNFTFADQVSYDLSLHQSSQGLRGAKIVISCIGIKPENELDAVNDIVNKDKDAQLSVLTNPRGLDGAGDVINRASTIASSDSFTTVMGYMQRIVKIGDAISEVSFAESGSLW